MRSVVTTVLGATPRAAGEVSAIVRLRGRI